MSVSPSMRWFVIAAAAVIMMLCVAFSMMVNRESAAARSLREASQLLAEERFDEAGAVAWKVANGGSEKDAAMLLVARAAARLKRSQLNYQRQSCDQRPAANATTDQLYQYADCLLDTGRVREAEAALRSVLDRAPEHHDAHHNLAMILRLENRYFEAQPHLLALYRQGDFRREYLMTTGRPDSNGRLTGGDDFYLDVCRRGTPKDPLPLLGQVTLEQVYPDLTPVLGLLEAILARDPELAEAQARRGWVLLMSGHDSEFLNWNRSLTSTAELHPLVWVVRGLFAKRNGDHPGAIHCWLRACELDPCHRLAFYELAQQFRSVGAIKRAEAFAHRANLLQRFEAVLSAPPSTRDHFIEAAELADVLQKRWEALGWALEAAALFPGDAQAKDLVNRFIPKVSPEMPLCVIDEQDDWNISSSEYPSPNWLVIAKKSELPAVPTRRRSSTRFEDRAASLGVNFSFHNGADPSLGIAYMFELSGGGIGVLDFDADGWPDLYLTQGCHWPVDHRQTSELDRLFRNVDGKRFEDVTSLAGLVESGLSQSASVGDINADGFQDVFVGNIGANRLWLNKGDGTFYDATETAGIAGNDWTASAALGDLNQDGLADLYVVNYLSGPDVFTRRCFHAIQNSVPVQCSPTLFPAAQDRVYQNRGDGSFADLTEESGVVAPDGKGMAVVLADFSGNGRLNVFVANDTTASFYFVNQVAQAGQPLRFVEQGVLTGVAYDASGNATSAMGVAAGDPNRDGLPDLFVTNFTREVKILYLQQTGEVFQDAIRESGLAQPGFAMMGWGTQFLDGDLDGHEDLFVANGDLFPTSQPYQMPQQYFQNQGNARFSLREPKSLGPYFMKNWLGRAVARLDLNRDGLADLAVTHVDAPFALLVNDSQEHGHFLKVRLRGVVSEREAVGATVRITANKETWSQQLIGGDGFAVSNERMLIFGLGDASQITEITVRWPSGTIDQFREPVPADSEVMLVEGSHQIVTLRRAP